jgi:hypothetical protein
MPHDQISMIRVGHLAGLVGAGNGAAVGAVAGGYTGKGVGKTIDPMTARRLDLFCRLQSGFRAERGGDSNPRNRFPSLTV